jgi:Ran GTPase-activating protein (RanGAP) involved in mRNA processing and transport
MELPRGDGPSNLAFESMLTHTQSLRSLSLICPSGVLEDWAMAAARSELKKNTTLRELTLKNSCDATKFSPIFTSLRDHPHLRRLCLRGRAVDLTGLETLLLSDTSKITELDIRRFPGNLPMLGLTPVLHALARCPTLTKLGLRRCSLGRDNARLLRIALCNIPSLQSLNLRCTYIGSAALAEFAPALYHNTSIKVLDMSGNHLNGMESATLLRDILRSNKTLTALDLSWNDFGRTTSAVECIVDGLGGNSTLLKIDLSSCDLGDGGVSIIAQSIGSRNTTLQKLTLGSNSITSTGVGVLLDMMEPSCHITDLDLRHNTIGNEGASLLARGWENDTLPNLTRLSFSMWGIGDDGFIELVSALEQNTSLLHLDLHCSHEISERAFLALAESLPEIKVLQRVDFKWCTGLASAMPLLLAGLRKNTSLFRFRVTNCMHSSVPPTTEETARCAGGWMQEIKRLGTETASFL